MGVQKSKRPLLAPSFVVDGSVTGISRVGRAQYNFAADGGAIALITPATNFTLPANSIITNVIINSTTAVTSAGAATVSIGLSAGGGGAAAFLAATGKATFSVNALVQGIVVPQDATKWIKTTAAGTVTLTVAAAAVTAGVIEIYVHYIVTAS